MDAKFPEKLIKGRIAEAIFEQMFRDQGEFEVIRNGYEYKTPQLAQSLLSLEHKDYLRKLRHAPDFVLLSWNKKQAFQVEVKYRSTITHELMEEAKKLHEAYGPCYLFVATPEKFYFDSCTDIIENDTLAPLSSSWISENLNEQYIGVMNTFIRK